MFTNNSITHSRFVEPNKRNQIHGYLPVVIGNMVSHNDIRRQTLEVHVLEEKHIVQRVGLYEVSGGIAEPVGLVDVSVVL